MTLRGLRRRVERLEWSGGAPVPGMIWLPPLRERLKEVEAAARGEVHELPPPDPKQGWRLVREEDLRRRLAEVERRLERLPESN
jgi:hypothetical protein